MLASKGAKPGQKDSKDGGQEASTEAVEVEGHTLVNQKIRVVSEVPGPEFFAQAGRIIKVVLAQGRHQARVFLTRTSSTRAQR